MAIARWETITLLGDRNFIGLSIHFLGTLHARSRAISCRQAYLTVARSSTVASFLMQLRFAYPSRQKCYTLIVGAVI